MLSRTLTISLLVLLCACSPLALPRGSAPPPQRPIALDALFNANANFDGLGHGFAAEQLPSPGTIVLGGTTFNFPGTAKSVIALGQTLRVPAEHYAAAYWLASASFGPAGGQAILTYADGSKTTVAMSAQDWILNDGSAVLSTTPGQGIFNVALPIDPTRVLQSITVPTTALPGQARPSLHLYALTLQPLAPFSAPAIVDARSTNAPQSDGGQTVSVTVQNLGLEWLMPQNPVTISIEGPGLHTLAPITVAELAPVEQARLQLPVAVDSSAKPGATVEATVVARARSGAEDRRTVELAVAPADYEAADASLARHAAPGWFENAKFGIFVHWGPYSVPAWAPAGSAYAEWYWYWLNQPSSAVAAHHLQTYGPDVVYDDFIPQLTAERFDPAQWVRLFSDAGARYFVFTAKHHDGFAMFGDTSNGRNGVALGPHRDLLKELFDAAQQGAPDMKRGVYYSLPEWYNPDYPGSFDRFGDGPPRNTFSGVPVPYTGYASVGDYVEEYQVPQLQQLISDYSPDILWCDIGGPNDSLTVLASYYNKALADETQVVANDRCGINEHDFLTPEYSKHVLFSAQKWEENRGIDPYSYGYNSATPDSAYMSGEAIVRELVDVVAKNGNLLLGIGPRADGTFPDVESDRLRDVGAWLRVNGEAIYDTTYWARAQEEQTAGEALRFTVASGRAFYATDLHAPSASEVVTSPVPIRDGDTVTLLGYGGGPLHWSKRADGALVIDVPPAAVASGRYAWTFKIAWH